MKSPSRRPQSLLIPACILILLATGALWYFFHRGAPPQPPVLDKQVQTEPSTSLAPKAVEPSHDTTVSPEGGLAPGAPDIKGKTTSGPTPALPTKEHLTQAAEKINAFYQYLDQQEYIQAHHLAAPCHIYFTRLIQKVLDTPPVVSRETDDLYTILKNSAHFFRILGKDDILLIKEILNHESAKIEELMAHYYLLSGQPDAMGSNLSLKIPENALYEYACFFLNTMGGKLYLTRRDSRTRMVVTYYAITIIDQAITNGKNSYGFQLQPAIDMLTAEIETGGNHLHYKEAYLDALYDLKEKHQ